MLVPFRGRRSEYEGDSLAAFVRVVKAETDRFMEGFAEDIGAELFRLIWLNTPVDTGRLRESWRRSPTRRFQETRGPVYEVRVGTDVDYAYAVERGTGLYGPSHSRYPIYPKRPGGFLSWVDPKTGRRQVRRMVMHPGSMGRQMVRLSLAELGATLEVRFEAEARGWVMRAEAIGLRNAKRNRVRF